MTQNNRNGKIITFYSFKGGVGRTMTVANLAFLAALNGKRVLVMDWDLEAPGLSFYFRGMQAASASLAFDNSPGLLDILCEWRTGLGKAESEAEIDLLQQQMESGQSFANCVHAVTQDDLAGKLFPAGACLDIIGPGAKNIAALDGLAYEAALAQFSWSEFFEQQAGGFVLEKMRQWAKNNYDFVFIDSRTGWVDIAGICTMQLPDIVALCFVLNQQNISGIARVAAAIRAKRGNEVSIRAVPMRVAQNDSALESDAQAHAQSALTRIGGFDVAALKMDMAELSIPLVDHLPFYETLAPFVARDPAFDPLTLSYLRLGNKLVDSTFVIPEFNQTVISNIKQRLQPRNATVEYIDSLRSATPERAYAELMQLTENAMATVANGDELDAAYLLAMLDAGLHTISMSDEPELTIGLADEILSVFRVLNNGAPDVWRTPLHFALEQVLAVAFYYGDQKNVLALRFELDVVLAAMPDLEGKLDRLQNLRTAGLLCLECGEIDALFGVVSKTTAIVAELEGSKEALSSQGKVSLLAATVDVRRLKGIAQKMSGREEEARLEFEVGLELLNDTDLGADNLGEDGWELRRLMFALHWQLAKLEVVPERIAAMHAVKATEVGDEYFRHDFLALAQVVLRVANNPEVVLDFCTAFLNSSTNQRGALAQRFFSRRPESIEFLFINIVFLKSLLTLESEQAAETVQALIHLLVNTVAGVFKLMTMRVMQNEEFRAGFELAIDDLIDTLEEAHFPVDDFPELYQAQAAFARMPAPLNPSPDGQ